MICVNDAWRMAPWAPHLYAADSKWWDMHIGAVRAGFSGQCWCPEDRARKHGITHIKGEAAPGLGADRVHFGRNSGYQAVNLALILGATRVLLLGYDMQLTGGKRHFFGDHPKGLRNQTTYAEYHGAFESMRPERHGLEVINCTRETALTCFPRVRLEDALASLRRAA